MPTRIANQYREGTSLGDTIGSLGQTLFGPGALQADLVREKSRGFRRENNAYDVIQNAARANPEINFNDPETAAALYGVDNPERVLQARRGVVTTNRGAMSPQAADAFVAAGGAYGSTGRGFERTQQVELEKNRVNAQKAYDIEEMRQDSAPINVLRPDGSVGVMSKREAIVSGATPVLSATDAQGAFRQQGFNNGYAGLNPQQQAAAGVEPKSPGTLYVYQTPDGRQGTTSDGVNDVQNKQPLPQGTKVMKLEGPNSDGLTSDSTVNRQVLDARIAKDQAVASIDRLSGMLQQPNADQAVGYLGTLARGFSDLRSQFEATSRLVGGTSLLDNINQPDVKNALDQATVGFFGNAAWNDRARQLGIDSSVIRSNIQDLAYTIAKAQDPAGRISVDDIRRASEVVGGSLMDPNAAVAVLGDLKARIIQNHDIRENATRQMYPSLGQQPAAPAGSPQTTPAAAPQQQPAGVEEWGRGPDGRLMRVR